MTRFHVYRTVKNLTFVQYFCTFCAVIWCRKCHNYVSISSQFDCSLFSFLSRIIYFQRSSNSFKVVSYYSHFDLQIITERFETAWRPLQPFQKRFCFTNIRKSCDSCEDSEKSQRFPDVSHELCRDSGFSCQMLDWPTIWLLTVGCFLLGRRLTLSLKRFLVKTGFRCNWKQDSVWWSEAE